MFELLGYPIQHIGITRLLARRWMREYHDMHLADINNDDDYFCNYFFAPCEMMIFVISN
jgi:hypothetical protein